jgi:hypothetical protein
MSSEAIGVVAPNPTEATIVMDGHDVHTYLSPKPHGSPKPTGLHSPPDSNTAAKLDGSDSELSDIEDMVEEQLKSAPPEAEDVDDIGEVVPDHWSGTVPVFKPTMHQFKDFKRFVCLPHRSDLCALLTASVTDGKGRLLWHEVRHCQDHPAARMERLASAVGRPSEADQGPGTHQARYYGIQRNIPPSQHSSPAFLQHSSVAPTLRPERTSTTRQAWRASCKRREAKGSRARHPCYAVHRSEQRRETGAKARSGKEKARSTGPESRRR